MYLIGITMDWVRLHVILSDASKHQNGFKLATS